MSAADEKSDAEVLKTRDDVEMLKRPHLWIGGRLCLKRRDKKGRAVAFGTIEAGLLQTGRAPSHAFPLVVEASTNDQVWEYPSAEAAVKAGWIVD
jgi:hypothetical protein